MGNGCHNGLERLFVFYPPKFSLLVNVVGLSVPGASVETYTAMCYADRAVRSCLSYKKGVIRACRPETCERNRS